MWMGLCVCDGISRWRMRLIREESRVSLYPFSDPLRQSSIACKCLNSGGLIDRNGVSAPASGPSEESSSFCCQVTSPSNLRPSSRPEATLQRTSPNRYPHPRRGKLTFDPPHRASRVLGLSTCGIAFSKVHRKVNSS